MKLAIFAWLQLRMRLFSASDGVLNIQKLLFDCTQTYEFKLDPKNRWVKRAAAVPWALVEERYAAQFDEGNGRPAHSARMALGSLVIQQAKGLSDEETLLEITESSYYLQYFIGLKEFTNEPPFDPSMMVHFRKRFTAEFMTEINEAMCRTEAKPKDVTPPEPPQRACGLAGDPGDDDDEPHGGTLILDATCAPANIKYLTDTSLLAEAIEKTDAMIDTLHEPFKGRQPRHRLLHLFSHAAVQNSG